MRTGIADIRIQLRLELAAPLVLAALAGLWSLGMLLSRAGLPPWAAAGHFAVWGVAVPLGLAAWLRKRAKTEPSSHGFDHLRAMAWLDLPDPALVFDERGKVLTYNSRLADLLNLPADAPSGGRELADLIGEDPSRQVERQWLLDTLAQRGHAEAFEIGLFDSAGDQLTLEGKAGRIGGRDSASYGVIWRDTTSLWRDYAFLSRRLDDLSDRFGGQRGELAQKIDLLARANRELQEIDEMRSDLVSLVSHQIRAPLTNMLGAVENMQDSCPAMTEVCSRMFVVLRDQASRLNRLVGDVLSAASLEAGDFALQLEPISLMPVLRQAVDQIAARGGRPTSIPYAPVMPLVMADRDRLTEVLVNLLDNADKYSPPGSGIAIEVRPTETEVILSVIDHGPGLPASDLTRVFDKFYRAEAGDAQRAYGYGLGLHICRLLIEAQRGRVWAENRPGGGAAFSLSLPVASP